MGPGRKSESNWDKEIKNVEKYPRGFPVFGLCEMFWLNTYSRCRNSLWAHKLWDDFCGKKGSDVPYRFSSTGELNGKYEQPNSLSQGSRGCTAINLNNLSSSFNLGDWIICFGRWQGRNLRDWIGKEQQLGDYKRVNGKTRFLRIQRVVVVLLLLLLQESINYKNSLLMSNLLVALFWIEPLDFYGDLLEMQINRPREWRALAIGLINGACVSINSYTAISFTAEEGSGDDVKEDKLLMGL